MSGRIEDTTPLLSIAGVSPSLSNRPPRRPRSDSNASSVSSSSSQVGAGGGLSAGSSTSIGSGRSRTTHAGTGGGGSASTGRTGRPPSGRITPTSTPGTDTDTAIPYGNGDHLAPHRSESEVTFKASGSRGIYTNQDQTQLDRSNAGDSGSSDRKSGRSDASLEGGASSPMMAAKKGQRRSFRTSTTSCGRGGRKGGNTRSTSSGRQHQYPHRAPDAGFDHVSWRQLQPEKKRSVLVYSCIGVCILAILLCVKTLMWPSISSSRTGRHSANGRSDDSLAKSEINEYPQSDGLDQEKSWMSNRGRLQHFDPRGRFVLEDFDAKPTFSDFLPAIAGIWGKPVWAFFVNRGQCVSSFGTKSKAYPIMEFNSANKAYQSTGMLGFRTFLRISRNGHAMDIEPFSPTKTRWDGLKIERSALPKRYMYIGSNEVQIRETRRIWQT